MEKKPSKYTVNKGLAISRPQPGCHYPNSPWPGLIDPIPVPGWFGEKVQESRNFFYSVGSEEGPLSHTVLQRQLAKPVCGLLLINETAPGNRKKELFSVRSVDGMSP